MYIVGSKKAIKRSILNKKSLLKLVLYSIFSKQYLIYTRFIYLRNFFTLADFYEQKVMQTAYLKNLLIN